MEAAYSIVRLSLLAASGAHAASDVHGRCLLQVGRGFDSLKPAIALGLVQSELIDTAEDRALVAKSVALGAGIGAVVFGVLVFAVIKCCLAAKEPKEQTRPTEGSLAAAAALEQEEQEECTAATHYQGLISLIAQKVAQEVGPKVSKCAAVHTVLGNRMSSFQHKARTFLVNEVRGATGAVLKECDAPGAMLLFDWDRSSEANFPPAAILVAGVFSPTILKVMSVHHFVQIVSVGLPILVLCICAIVIDKSAPCSIPTTYEWLHTQTFLASMLVLGHGALSCKVWLGQRRLQAKVLEIHEQNNKKEDATKMLDEFVGNTIVLQEALLIENGIRKSWWSTVVGLATIGWVISSIWCFVVVVGWTLVPGIVAFHPTLRADPAYCGAWVTVMVMNINVLLTLLFLIINLGSVAKWVCDSLIESQTFQESVLDQAREMDRAATGLPVMELLAQAFLLRGDSETIDSQLAKISTAKAVVEKEKTEVQAELKAMETEIAAVAAQELAIKADAESRSGGIGEQISKLSKTHDDYKAWKAQGEKAVAEAEEKALAVREATSKALQELWEKITEAVDAIQNSETAEALIAKAQQAEALIEEEASEAIAAIMKAQWDSEGSSSSRKSQNEAIATTQKARWASATSSSSSQPPNDAAKLATAQARELADSAIAAANESKWKKQKSAV